MTHTAVPPDPGPPGAVLTVDNSSRGPTLCALWAPLMRAAGPIRIAATVTRVR